MKRTEAVAMGLAAVLMATTTYAGALQPQQIQSPRAQEVQAPRDHTDDIQAPRSQDEVQAPRSQDEVQAPRGQDRTR